MDANGIMHVKAEETGTGKSEKIQITNDAGRLSKEDIEKMVSDGVKFAEEDKQHADRVLAKNGLESYAYGLRNTLDQKELKDKLSPQDLEQVQTAIKTITDWLETNENAGKDEFEAKQKELEEVTRPIVTKVYSSGAAGATDSGPNMSADQNTSSAPSTSSSGPHIEEVD